MRGQRAAVLEYLQNVGHITSMEAIEMFGATRLSAIIFDLRKLGYDIETKDMVTKNRFGETCNFAKYVYNGKAE